MQPRLKEIKHCEVCGSVDLDPVVNLGLHPMCDDLIPVGDPRSCHEYPIEILFCDKCCTAHQKYQIDKRVLFPKSYHYRSRHTGDVLRGMRSLVEACVSEFGSLQDVTVLDIGCNDGSLLDFFKDAGAKTFGIEPTGAAEETQSKGHVVTEDFLTEKVAQDFVDNSSHPQIITLTNVFAHIEDLESVIRCLKRLAGKDTTIVIENHYLGSILDKFQFDTFYHEHPRTYSYRSFEFVADALNFKIRKVQFPSRYGGNIRIFLSAGEGSAGHSSPVGITRTEADFGARLRQMPRQIELWRKHKKEQLNMLVQEHGKLPAKAFPGRAAIPLKLLDIDNDVIDRVYEKPGSAKIGHYVPGTRVVIASDDDFPVAACDRPLLNLAWHISDEITLYMRERGFSGQIVDVISPSEF